MHTNIDIDQALLKEAQELGRCRTKRAAVNEALAEYVRVRKQRNVLELFGKLDWDPDYDYKAERSAR